MFTLSFSEYLGMREYLGLPQKPESQIFQEYLTYGGCPKALEYEDLDAKAMYIQDVIGQIFNKDIAARKVVRHRDTFQRVQDYLINNYAAPTNLSGIVDYLKPGEGVTVKRELCPAVGECEGPLQMPAIRFAFAQVVERRGEVLSCGSWHTIRT